MKLELFKSLWGWQGDWSQCAAQLRAMGGVGVETRMPADPAATRTLAEALRNEDMAVISVVLPAAM